MHALSSHQTSYLHQIEAYVARMPSLSATATKLLETCNNPHPMRTDVQLDELTQLLCDRRHSGDTNVFFAREGMQLKV
ncbi:MAG: hypothetical protein KJP06_06495 [Deltaproteobacteria bacterium]|nr:hypothetical protein [Deltaproteobacteria bacterium]